MSEIRFHGRVALVTSAGRGLCAAYARAIGARGAMVEGAPHGIRANAVAPVAATRMLRRATEPGELSREQVVPGVVFLSSERCTFSGKVLESCGGEFDVARWISSDEVDFGRDPVAPETIAERWDEIEGAVHA